MAGVLQGFAELLARNDIPPAAINEIVVGATTVVTNLIIERKGARTGLIVTKGFADVIEIGVRDSGAWRGASRGGRGNGLRVIRGLMDEVTVEASDEGTAVRMRRKAGA